MNSKLTISIVLIILLSALGLFVLISLLNPGSTEVPSGTGTQGNTQSCTANTVVCVSDPGWADAFGNNATRVGWGAFCNSTGTGLANDGTIFDACAPQIQASAGTDCTSLNLTRFSRGEGSNGAFVGCQGTNNVYCAESGVTYCTTTYNGTSFACTNSPAGCSCGVDPGQSVSGSLVVLPDIGSDSCARPRNNQIAETRYSCNGATCVEDPNGQYTNPSCDNQCQETQVCPSTQPRFQVIENGQDQGLVSSGIYNADDVDEVNSIVIINNEVNPPNYFQGVINVTAPGFSQTFNSGSPQSLPVSKGTYTINTSVDGNQCGSVNIELIGDNPPVTYTCNTNTYQCVEAGTGGEYSSLASCSDNCVEVIVNAFCGDSVCETGEYCERDGSGSFRECLEIDIDGQPTGSVLTECRGLTDPTGTDEASGSNICTYCGDGVIQGNEECDGGSDCDSQCQLIVEILEPEFIVEKTGANVCDASSNAEVTYNITVSNIGEGAGTVDTIEDTIDSSLVTEGLAPTNISSGGTYMNGVITWELTSPLSDFEPQQSKDFTYVISIPYTSITNMGIGSIDNTVSVTDSLSNVVSATENVSINCTLPTTIPNTAILGIDESLYIQFGLLMVLTGLFIYLYDPYTKLNIFFNGREASKIKKQDLEYNEEVLKEFEDKSE